MRVIISPAKKMREDVDSLPWKGLPRYLEEAERLLGALRDMSAGELKKLWKCNDQIVRLNLERLEHMDLRSRLTPAVLSYEGIQYQYMAPGVFTGEELDYVEEHLRILSGFYGILRPFDGVTPYRLEMGAKLEVQGAKNLYQFWGDKLAKALAEESDWVVNLASKEYSQAVSKYMPHGVRWVTCVFGQLQGDKVVERGTLCKMARGEMVRYMAQNQVEAPEELLDFEGLEFRYAPHHSREDQYVFLRP